MTDTTELEKEKHTKLLKRKMECWREVILPLYSILLWEQSWYPGLIVGFTTTLFFLIWFLEPTLLTLISMALLILALVDYLVPTLTSAFCNPNNWTGQKEKKLNKICQNLAIAILQLQSLWRSLVQTRNDRPNIYYGVTTFCLILFAWIGNVINNLLLFYLAVNGILLAPGLKYEGRAQNAMKFAYNYLAHRFS